MLQEDVGRSFEIISYATGTHPPASLVVGYSDQPTDKPLRFSRSSTAAQVGSE